MFVTLINQAVTIGDSNFRDSALGSSLTAGSSYAKTVMSYRDGGDH